MENEQILNIEISEEMKEGLLQEIDKKIENHDQDKREAYSTLNYWIRIYEEDIVQRIKEMSKDAAFPNDDKSIAIWENLNYAIEQLQNLINFRKYLSQKLEL